MSAREDRFHTTSWDANQVKSYSTSGQGGGKKGKPEKKKRLIHPLAKIVIWVIAVIASSYLLASVGWMLANDLCAFNKTKVETTIEIPAEWISVTKEIEKDDGTVAKIVVCDIDKVTEKLKAEGLIEYEWLFRLFAWFYKADEKIQQGAYTLDSSMDYMALIRGMRGAESTASAVTVNVSIPEGYNVRQIIALLAENGVASEEALLDAAKNHVFDGYAFIDNENLGDSSRLEGYLYPDTYNFYVGGSAVNALDTLLRTFDRKIYSNEELSPLLEEAYERGYTLQQIITIASLIEKETDGSDRNKIASVIYNRLENAAETAYFLQIDASLVYALGREVTKDDYANLDSLYNLYKNTGLPPTPIANPGYASIYAALKPADTNYYFYVLGPDGQHIFNETLKGHQNTIAQMG